MTDEDIIKKVQRGDIEFYSILVDRYKDKIFRLIYRYTNDYSETQDIAQEVFIKIYKQIHAFRFQSKVSTWFYRITTNSCIDWDRKRRKEKNNISLDDDEMVMDGQYNPEEQVLFNEKREVVKNIVDRLPEKYKILIVMYHFHNLKYKEISEILDIPVKTIETRLYRGRGIIKKQIEIEYKGGEALWTVGR